MRTVVRNSEMGPGDEGGWFDSPSCKRLCEQAEVLPVMLKWESSKMNFY